MFKISFRCTFLSDVVLNSQSATEGVQPSLSYVPGSNFLGMAARKLYCDEQLSEEQKRDIFHRGVVTFGDAHIEVKEHRAYKVPASWFYKKGKSFTDDEVYVHHKVPSKYLNKMIGDGTQLKQSREGYFICHAGKGKQVSINKQFSLKSAYDADKRKSKDSQMYGYEALEAGTRWQFTITSENREYLELMIDALKGDQQLGRSRTAQYGWVYISEIGSITEAKKHEDVTGVVSIYAASDWALVDRLSNPIYKPTLEIFNLPEGSEILWDKSQIRTRVYTLWNGKRATRDLSRMVIEKGSVLVVKTNGSWTDHPHRVGCFTSEGLGEYLVNPFFLDSCQNDMGLRDLDFVLDDEDKKNSCLPLHFVNQEAKKNTMLKSYLDRRKRRRDAAVIIQQVAMKFKRQHHGIYKEVSSSQWGSIRSYALSTNDKSELWNMLFKENGKKSSEVGYLVHGVVTQDLWEQRRRAVTLKKAIENSFDEYLPQEKTFNSEAVVKCVEKIAALMQKG
ncbi:hypothetical protein K4L44_06565 [Halosquirtibacter laminarini]|uniref:Uncharacterized protein n=1 Tax=Halosquirtibacter laminarini TaxID=3374600 RepID=A0AC61NRA6_9BACT|nr:hypothetical protein K4L44_06565 [Prolixibacteraceae bacterium]